MIIIGITGTIGAGKGTIVKYLVEKYGFKHFSARSVFIEELEKRNAVVNRDTITDVANELRAANSPSYIAEKLYERAIQENNHSVIESLRTVGEIEALRTRPEPFFLLAIDAPIQLRYERVYARKSVTDSITFEKFLYDEEREMTSSDPTKQNISACFKHADYILYNDKSLEDLHIQIDRVMHELLLDQ